MKYTDENINEYLSGEMDSAGRKLFAEALQNDASLRKRVAFYEEMDALLSEDDWAITAPETQGQRVGEYADFLHSTDGDTLKKTVADASDQYFTAGSGGQGKQVFGWFGKLSVAAGFLLMVAVAAFYMFNNPSASELYVAYKDSARLPSLVNRSSVSDLSRFVALYEKGKNKEALSWLEGYLSSQPAEINPQLYLYKGELHLKLNQDAKAIETYQALLNSNTVDAEKARWFLALVYLKTGDKTSAENELRQLVNGDSAYQNEEAREILEKL